MSAAEKKNSNQLSIFYQIISFVINYMKIMNTQNDQWAHEIQTLFNYMIECQQKQFFQFQLLIFDNFIFWLKTAHSAVFKLKSATSFFVTEFNQYTFIHASIASFSCHVTSLLLLAEHEMFLLFKYHMYHMIRTVKTL